MSYTPDNEFRNGLFYENQRDRKNVDAPPPRRAGLAGDLSPLADHTPPHPTPQGERTMSNMSRANL